jgi:hypothetical protein
MAFYITVDNRPHSTWYANQKKPLIGSNLLEDERDFTLIADGDELEQIKVRFVNVPHCHHITTWRGDMARFIFENLPDNV